MSNLILRAIKRRYSSPEAVMAKLGLDAHLLDETREELRRARTRRRLANDAGEAVLPDDDEPGGEEILTALKAVLAKGRLSDVQKDWAIACLSGEDVGDPPGDDDAVAQDDPPPFPGRPNPGGKIDPLRSPAMDAAFAARFPDSARIGLGAATAPPAKRGLTSRGASSRAMAAFASRFPNAARIKIG